MRAVWLLLILALAGGAANARAETCQRPSSLRAAAAGNAASLSSLIWSPFGRPETGWDTYAPRIAAEIGTACAADTPGFARALARWRKRHGLGGDGTFDTVVFQTMKQAWQDARPFVSGRKDGACPEAPDLAVLEAAAPEESDGGKIILLYPRTLAAYRRMVEAARKAVPEAAADPERLMLFSGYRAPADDAARCSAEGNCNGLVRAACSAHRTGIAFDLYLGSAPRFDPDSTADANRLWQSRTATYRWLVANARRFGFVNYVFEPWHWEWVGETR